MRRPSDAEHLNHHLGSRVLEGGLALSRRSVGLDGSGPVSSHPLNESARSYLIETGPDQSRDVAYRLPSASGTAEDLDRAPIGGRTRSAVSKRLAKRPQRGPRSLQYQRFRSVGGGT